MAKSSKGEGWSKFAAGREHPRRGRAGFGADLGGIQEQDAAMVASETPGDGRADDAAAGDDDVEAIRHGYRRSEASFEGIQNRD